MNPLKLQEIITYLRSDFLEYYYVFLKADLQLASTCHAIHKNILQRARDTAMFEEEEVRCYDDLNTRENDPLRVKTIKHYLKIIHDIELIAKNIEAIDMTSDRFTLLIAADFIYTLFNNLNPLFLAIQDINRNTADVMFIVDPLLSQLLFRVQFAKDGIKNGQAWIEEVKTINASAFQRMAPIHLTGLSLISQWFVYLPKIIDELRELIECGDNQIDFDPSDPALKITIKTYEKKLRRFISDRTFTHFAGAAGIITQLLQDSGTILTSAAAFTEASAINADALLERIHHHYIPQLISELEQIEEVLGIKNGYLVNLVEIPGEQNLIVLRQSISSLNGVAASVRRLQTALANAPIQTILSNVVLGSATPENTVFTVIMKDQPFNQALFDARSRRLTNALDYTRYRDEKQATAVFFERVNAMSQHVFRPNQLHRLPGSLREELKEQYTRFQHHAALVDPKLDQLIVRGLNNTHPNNYRVTKVNESIQLSMLALISSLFLPSKTIQMMYWLAIVYAAYQYTELKLILSHKKNILDHIEQTHAQNLAIAKQIKRRDSTLIPLQIETYPASEHAPLVECQGNHHYQDLFARIKSWHISSTITDFYLHYFLPTLSECLDEATHNGLFADELPRTLTLIPNSNVYQNSETVQVYKTFINALYHLHACLDRLEKMDERQSVSWTFYQRGVDTKECLYAVLCDGLNAYIALQAVATHPLISKLMNDGLHQLRALESLPIVGSLFQAQPEVAAVVKHPYDAFNLWKQRQDLEERMLLNQETPDHILNTPTASTIIVLAPEPVELEIIEPLEADPDAATDLPPYVQSIVRKLHKLQTKYHQVRQGDVIQPIAEEEIQQKLIELSHDFFENLKDILIALYTKLYPTITNAQIEMIDNWIVLLKTAPSLQGIIAPTKTHIQTMACDIGMLLRLIEGVGPFMQDKAHINMRSIIEHINLLHTIASYHCIQFLDDAEFHSGVKPGLLTHEISQTLEAWKNKIIENLPTNPAQLQNRFDLSIDDTFLKFRIKGEKQRLQHIKHEIDHVFAEMTAFWPAFRRLKQFNLNQASSFDNEMMRFCAQYQAIQPSLKKINEDCYLRIKDKKSLEQAIEKIKSPSVVQKLKTLWSNEMNNTWIKETRGKNRLRYFKTKLNEQRMNIDEKFILLMCFY